MPEKVFVLVPPYRQTTDKAHKIEAEHATLLMELAREFEKDGRVISVNFPTGKDAMNSIRERSDFLLDFLKHENLKGKDVVFVGHSLGAQVLKNCLGELDGMVGRNFTVVSIASMHSGQLVERKGDKLNVRLQEQWRHEFQNFKKNSDNPEVPKRCRLIEFHSLKDPAYRYESSAKQVIMNLRSLLRRNTHIVRVKPDKRAGAFSSQHLFLGNEKKVAAKVVKHLK